MSAKFSSIFKRQEKTKQVSSTKEHLIPWLRSALDNDLYPGLMGWVDRKKGEFYMAWIHKKSGQWSEDKLRALIAYAEQKGRLKGKTHTQIKSLLRCAVNSKKGEIQKLKEDKESGRIYYKFVDPTAGSGKIANKRRKHHKVINGCGKRLTKSVSSANNLFSVNKEIATPIKTRFSGLSISSSSKETFPLEPALPPFETCFSFRSSKIFPEQENEVYLMSTEFMTDGTYPEEQNLLISAQEFVHIFRDSCNGFSADQCQSNCRPVHHSNKQLKVLSEFHSGGFSETSMNMSTNQENKNDNNFDSPDNDQYGPVVSLKANFQFLSRNEQSCKTGPKDLDSLSEMDLDDFILCEDVNEEEYRKLMQELDISTSITQYGLHN